MHTTDPPSPPVPSWLPAFRDAWYAGAALLVAATHLLAIPMPLLELVPMIGVGVASNLWLRAQVRRGGASARAVAVLLALDTGLLTLLLLRTGGAYNPFSLQYLVLVAVAAHAARGAAAWLLTLWTVAAFAVLFGVQPRELEVPPQTHAEHVAFHLRGMWVAAGVAAGYIAWFVGRLHAELERHAAALASEREARARAERLASLATLAAGAAHELATPLSTIAVVASDLAETLAAAIPSDAEIAGQARAEAVEDARLIGAEVQRCRAVLDRMAADAGHPRGEPAVRVTAEELVAAVRGRLPTPIALHVAIEAGVGAVSLPLGSVAVAIAGLCDNAARAERDAGRSAAPELRVRGAAGGWEIAVADRGVGIDAAARARVGEPFYTTRDHGQGMGLGVFLAREVAARLGGRLDIASAPGQGTIVTMVLPAAPATMPAAGEVLGGGR